MKKLSGFDLTMIIVFVVVGLLGGGAWFYLSSQLATAQSQVNDAKTEFDRYSSKEPYLPTASNLKAIQNNIDLIKAQLDPIIKSKFQSDQNKLSSITKQDTVAWKHDLDAEMLRLNSAAKLHGVGVPENFYYSFSSYLSTAPGEEKTLVLSKQLVAVEQIANIFINAPVKSIQGIRRTYEEDVSSTGSTGGGNSKSGDVNFLSGSAVTAPGGIYTAYPFEIEFEANTDGLRKVIDDLMESPYVFVVRSLTIQNSQPTSPQVDSLDKMAGTTSPAVGESTPGAVAATTSSKGPQYLFGGEVLHVKARVDMIEWKASLGEADGAKQ